MLGRRYFHRRGLSTGSANERVVDGQGQRHPAPQIVRAPGARLLSILSTVALSKNGRRPQALVRGNHRRTKIRRRRSAAPCRTAAGGDSVAKAQQDVRASPQQRTPRTCPTSKRQIWGFVFLIGRCVQMTSTSSRLDSSAFRCPRLPCALPPLPTDRKEQAVIKKAVAVLAQVLRLALTNARAPDTNNSAPIRPPRRDLRRSGRKEQPSPRPQASARPPRTHRRAPRFAPEGIEFLCSGVSVDRVV